MSRKNRVLQPVSCLMGVHESPPPRDPAGPIAAYCPCCGKSVYFYGLSLQGCVGSYPVLAQRDYPKILGPARAFPSPA